MFHPSVLHLSYLFRYGEYLVRSAIITQPYAAKAQAQDGNLPIWTFVNDDFLLPFYAEFGFVEGKGKDVYKPDKGT